MKRRVTFFITDAEFLQLQEHAARVNLPMSRIIGNAVRAVASGTITVADNSIIVNQESTGPVTFRMLKPETPTQVSVNPPVPEAPVDTIEYKRNMMFPADNTPGRMTEDEDGGVWDQGWIPAKLIKAGGKK